MNDLEYIACPYCGGAQSDPWTVENGYTAVKCRECGLVYVNPRPAQSAIKKSVEIGIHATVGGELDMVGGFDEAMVWQLKKRLLELFPGHELRGRMVKWLDIGTGHGELLLALDQIVSRPSIIRGVEPCKPRLESARKRGLDVTDQDLADIDGEYDYVSLVNVFSHLVDPRGFLTAIRQKIRSGGSILLVTGNGGDIRAEEYPDPLYLPDHLLFAGEAHIVALLQEADFGEVIVQRYRRWLPEKSLRRRMQAALMNVRDQLRGKDTPFRAVWVRARAV